MSRAPGKRYSDALDEYIAKEERKKDRVNPNRKLRTCLFGCPPDKLFLSEGPGHRCCPIHNKTRHDSAMLGDNSSTGHRVDHSGRKK